MLDELIRAEVQSVEFTVSILITLLVSVSILVAILELIAILIAILELIEIVELNAI